MAVNQAALVQEHEAKVADLESQLDELRQQLEASAVALAKEATDKRRLEERRVNLMEDMAAAAAAAAAGGRAGTAVAGAPLGGDSAGDQLTWSDLVSDEQKVMDLTAQLQREKDEHKTTKTGETMSDYSAAKLSEELRVEQALTVRRQDEIDRLEAANAQLRHDKQKLGTRLQKSQKKGAAVKQELQEVTKELDEMTATNDKSYRATIDQLSANEMAESDADFAAEIAQYAPDAPTAPKAAA